jgi:hypothetical protein
MPRQKRTPAAMPSDELLLAAIDRAERHRVGGGRGVLLATFKEHLGVARGGWSTRQLRPQLDRLLAESQLEQLRRGGLDIWAITDAGRRRLAAARRADLVPPLPEAPQHRRWREAQAAASERIAGFRGELRGALDEAIAALEADHEADSATWFEFSERLRKKCWLLAAAIHCLREWPEPDDAHADSDDPPYRQGGRRDIHGWDRW